MRACAAPSWLQRLLIEERRRRGHRGNTWRREKTNGAGLVFVFTPQKKKPERSRQRGGRSHEETDERGGNKGTGASEGI